MKHAEQKRMAILEEFGADEYVGIDSVKDSVLFAMADEIIELRGTKQERLKVIDEGPGIVDPRDIMDGWHGLRYTCILRTLR